MPFEKPSAQEDSAAFSLTFLYFSFIVLPNECYLHENATFCFPGAGPSLLLIPHLDVDRCSLRLSGSAVKFDPWDSDRLVPWAHSHSSWLWCTKGFLTPGG